MVALLTVCFHGSSLQTWLLLTHRNGALFSLRKGSLSNHGGPKLMLRMQSEQDNFRQGIQQLYAMWRYVFKRHSTCVMHQVLLPKRRRTLMS